MKKPLLSFLAIGALVLAGCADDEFTKGNATISDEGEGVGFMAFSISTEPGSRADNVIEGDEPFNKGTEYDVAPHNNAHAAFFFYGDDQTDLEDGEFYGASYLTPYQKDDGNGHNHGDNSDYIESEQFYTYVTRFNNSKPELLPKKVVVLINFNPDRISGLIESLKNKPKPSAEGGLAALLKEVTGEKEGGIFNHNQQSYFSMTNSVFLSGSDIINYTEIDPAVQICKTAEEALSKRVTVFVERLLAKHTLSVNNAGNTTTVNNGGALLTPVEGKATIKVVKSYTGDVANLDWPDLVEATWAAYITGWNMNGLEKSSYLLKKANASGSYFANWSNSALHRSYWAESPKYAEGEYPTQVRQYYNDPDYTTTAPENGWDYFQSAVQYDDGGQSEFVSALKFISFNDIAKKEVNGVEVKGLNDARYSLERTYDSEALTFGSGFKANKGFTPYRYGTHFLIGSQLVFEINKDDFHLSEIEENAKVNTDGGMLTGILDKYYAYEWWWINKADYLRYSYRKLSSSLADGREHKIGGQNRTFVDDAILYTKSGDDTYTALAVSDAASKFYTAPATVYHGDGKVIPQVDPSVTLYAKVYVIEDNEVTGTEYVAFEPVEIEEHIKNILGAAKHYTEGAMYYAIPVQHKLGRSNGNRVEIGKFTGYENEAEAYKLGQFGVVRNHWYQLTINSAVNNMGIPVDDPTQEIIPDPEEEWTVAFEIVVVPWHVINNGIVDL